MGARGNCPIMIWKILTYECDKVTQNEDQKTYAGYFITH
jgi:hypothetical protein